MKKCDDADRLCTLMNSNIRFLTRVCHNKINNNETYRIQKSVNTLINIDPTAPLSNIGPYLVKYAEPISKHDDVFFAKCTFDDVVGADEYINSINMVKNMYSGCTDDEKNKIKTVMSDMLSIYCEYATKCI